MRVFLTGASGFIGASVLRALLARGHEVLTLALPEDPMERLRAETGRFAVVCGRLQETDSWRPALKSFVPEACLHLAWYAVPGKYLDAPENLVSLNASLDLLSAMRDIGCGQVVMAGTCAEYDADFGYMTEQTPAKPLTLYAASKLACCLLGQQIALKAGIRFAWGRVFFPYGPEEDERRLIPCAIRALQEGRPFPATPGEQVRDYLHVNDVAAAFCTLLERRADGVFNIASGRPVTIRALLQMIGALMGRAELLQLGARPYRQWDPAFICGDNKRLKGLGWAPQTMLEEGLTQTIEWWRTHSISPA